MIKKGFSYIGIFFLLLLSLLPFFILQALAAFLYYPLYYLIGYRKKVVRENLARSFPKKSKEERLKIEKAFFKYFVQLVIEIVKLSSLSKKQLLKRVKFTDLSLIESYFSNQQSVLCCSGHYANWELCMVALGHHLSCPSYVIYKPINNKIFEKWFHYIRTKFGNRLVTMRQTLRSIIATKEETTMFCFAFDQTPVKSEVQYVLRFLNQPTAVLLGLEKIALQTNRPIVYFDVKCPARGYYEIDCLPVCLDPSATKDHEITDQLYQFLERTIVANPAYWLWSHRRWKLNVEGSHET